MSEKTNRVDFVIGKYRLNETSFVEAEEHGKLLGHGNLLSDEAFNQFLAGDPSGNYKYLDWMLFIAGGGQDSMNKSIRLWQGDNVADPNSLRNQCRADFIAENQAGFTDSTGLRHPPKSLAEAEAAWSVEEGRSYFEFIMGDQDITAEEGYGFYRNWPGKDGIYQRVVNAVKLWHSAQPKLLAQNQRQIRATKLREAGAKSWSLDDRKFLETAPEPAELVELDIYAGWKPKSFTQAGATYNTLQALNNTLASVRKMAILKDTRHEVVYQDELVTALCPLTVGAAIKFGIGKWCVCNRSEFDRSFEHTSGGMPIENNWVRYNRMGPMVFLIWHIPMPAYLHKLALHVKNENVATIINDRPGWTTDLGWIDCQNLSSGSSQVDVLDRLRGEATGLPRLKRLANDIQVDVAETSEADERYYKWGGRSAGQAWMHEAQADKVISSLDYVLKALPAWLKTFNRRNVVLDYVNDSSGPVDKIDD